MAEVKQGAIKHFKVDGLRGTFLDTLFDDECQTVGTVTPSTEKALREYFGDSVKEVKTAAQKSKPSGGDPKAGGKNADGEGGGAGEGSVEGGAQ